MRCPGPLRRNTPGAPRRCPRPFPSARPTRWLRPTRRFQRLSPTRILQLRVSFSCHLLFSDRDTVLSTLFLRAFGAGMRLTTMTRGSLVLASGIVLAAGLGFAQFILSDPSAPPNWAALSFYTNAMPNKLIGLNNWTSSNHFGLSNA